ncbi:unnamed protein product [Phytomonas sp. EM1]|nr:unnamed protein product [Phytomonas sp. EM1]|eukprot:CCW65100.1 unnamed protein product [Phytomonas sp. isolate EM1]
MLKGCCSKPRVKNHTKGDACLSYAVDESHIIDGVLYPRYEREIDHDGFECSHHTLKFHGCDWDIPLTQRRSELTRSFIEDASVATNESEDNIKNLRFFVDDTYLLVKFTLRHQSSISAESIQSDLIHYRWKRTKSLYQPREKKPRPLPLTDTEEDKYSLRNPKPHLACDLNKFGRPNTGEEGPTFRNEKDTDEEPFPYEVQRSASEKVNAIYGNLSVL